MKIDRELILKLEKLSRLELSEEERQKMQVDLGKMLEMVKKLEEVDLDTIKPLTHLTTQNNVTRPDQVEEHIDRQKALDNAPDSMNEYFKVPKVIKK